MSYEVDPREDSSATLEAMSAANPPEAEERSFTSAVPNQGDSSHLDRIKVGLGEMIDELRGMGCYGQVERVRDLYALLIEVEKAQMGLDCQLTRDGLKACAAKFDDSQLRQECDFKVGDIVLSLQLGDRNPLRVVTIDGDSIDCDFIYLEGGRKCKASELVHARRAVQLRAVAHEHKMQFVAKILTAVREHFTEEDFISLCGMQNKLAF